MHEIFNTCNKNLKQLRKCKLKNIIPRSLIDKIRQLQKKPQKIIEQRDAALVLIGGDLQAIKYETDAKLMRNIS